MLRVRIIMAAIPFDFLCSHVACRWMNAAALEVHLWNTRKSVCVNCVVANVSPATMEPVRLNSRTPKNGFSGASLGVTVAIIWTHAAIAANLVECPDCGKDVSPRAISCPHCGCPGEFIAEAVQRKEEEKKPKAVVQVKAEAAGGFGVAVEEDGMRFVILPVAAVGSAESLNLRTIQGAELPYSHLEVAKEVSLIRFRVTSEFLAYLRRSTAQGDAPAAFLDESGISVAAKTGRDAGRSIARVSPEGEVAALNVGGKSGEQWVALNQPIEWAAVEPSRFREQAGLLARLAQRKPAEALAAADRTALEKADWICREFRERAQTLLSAATPSPRKTK